MEEVKEIIINTRKELDQLEAETPEFKEKYYKKYVDARKEVGLDMDSEKAGQNFMKFLVEDAVLPGIDDIEDGSTKASA